MDQKRLRIYALKVINDTRYNINIIQCFFEAGQHREIVQVTHLVSLDRFTYSIFWPTGFRGQAPIQFEIKSTLSSASGADRRRELAIATILVIWLVKSIEGWSTFGLYFYLLFSIYVKDRYGCNRWWRLRSELKAATNMEFLPETTVKTMLESREKWNAVCGFIVQVLKTRKEEERQRQRDPANN